MWPFSKKKKPRERIPVLEPVEEHPWITGTGIGEPFATRLTDYGLQHLMQSTGRCVLWRECLSLDDEELAQGQKMALPIHRHEMATEVISVMVGRLLVNEYNAEGEQVLERLIISGDVYKIPHGRWHSVKCIGSCADLLILHFPGDSDWNVSDKDYEEWKPARIIGYG